MKINDTVFNQLANLAKLEFTADERENLKEDLKDILNFVNQIMEVDTENVEPLIHICETSNVFRSDDAKNRLDTNAALQNAPLKKDNYFAVPKVINK